MKILSIEGNIGAGKSTLLNELQCRLKNNPYVIFMLEPTSVWENIKDDEGHSVLEKFYSDQEKYAFSFQIMAFATRIQKMRQKIKDNPDAKVMICERSLEADYNIFAKMLHSDKKIEDINYKIYLEFYKIFKEDYPIEGIIYIDASPEICYQRIKMRSRNGEEDIPLTYLQQCDKYHKTWLFEHNTARMLQLQTDYQFSDESDKKIYFHLWTNQMTEFIGKFM
uniref:Deoxynucleoside kinase domain-containing protein n=1 Tax=viral metagenome TaxID=1070528 RepID=A0A6C0C106_9ZZZZ